MEEQLYKIFFEIENSHWWFVARQKILEDFLHRRLKLDRRARVLDVGCGTGGMLEVLARSYDVYGTDTSALAVSSCRRRGLANVYQCTLDTFPQADTRFDLITLLDVIEHVDDDRGLLKQAKMMVRQGGYVLVTVPAFMFLWSNHDKVNHHKRRYVRRQLRNVLEDSGFEVMTLSYFNTLLFPAAVLTRLFQRLRTTDAEAILKIPPPPINNLLTSLFASERYLLRAGRLPFGLSLIALARSA